MANNLTLSVTLTGDGRQLTGTLRNAQGEVREFGGTTERESARAERALEGTGRQAQTVSGHLNRMRNIALGAATALVGMAGGLSLSRVISETAQFEDSILGLQAVSGSTIGQRRAFTIATRPASISNFTTPRIIRWTTWTRTCGSSTGVSNSVFTSILAIPSLTLVNWKRCLVLSFRT